jgi:hypothetical protein
MFEPTVKAVPRDLRGKLEPAQVYHEVLEHRWYLAQAAEHDVPMPVATASYVKNILPTKDDEQAVLGRSLAEMTAELPALTAEHGTHYAPADPFETPDNMHAWGEIPEPSHSDPPTVRRRSLKGQVAPDVTDDPEDLDGSLDVPPGTDQTPVTDELEQGGSRH